MVLVKTVVVQDGVTEEGLLDVVVGVVGFRCPTENGYGLFRCANVGDGGYCLMATVGLTVDRGAEIVGRYVEDRLLVGCLVEDSAGLVVEVIGRVEG